MRRTAKARRIAVVSTAALASWSLTACFGTGGSAPQESPDTQQTVTFWHGWSLPNDIKALDANIARFEQLHPNITVKTTPNVSDDKLLQGLRGRNGPDVVSSFTADDVGAFCNGALADLNPYLERDHVDKAAVFVRARLDYTQYQGKQCTLPLLGDAFGLYYNTDMFAAAGITAPPKTWSEFTADAVKLTRKNGDTYSQLGFMPSFHGYETQPTDWMNQWNPRYLDADGKSALRTDPAAHQFFTYTRSLSEALGGYDRLERYRATFGEEFSSQNAFEAKKVAMQLDGEWRVANIREDKVDVPYATAPLPVPDDQLDSYGKGYLTGTVVGIAQQSPRQAAAWELVKFLTTDTPALVSFANAINNVPSTTESLRSPELTSDPKFATFLHIAAHPASATTPSSSNGGEFSTILLRFAYKWEAGEVTDLDAGLAAVDKQIDQANEQTR